MLLMNHQISYFGINWLSVTDGPGKLPVLFLQECPSDCSWCHSPHSQPRQSPFHGDETTALMSESCIDRKL